MDFASKQPCWIDNAFLSSSLPVKVLKMCNKKSKKFGDVSTEKAHYIVAAYIDLPQLGNIRRVDGDRKIAKSNKKTTSLHSNSHYSFFCTSEKLASYLPKATERKRDVRNPQEPCTTAQPLICGVADPQGAEIGNPVRYDSELRRMRPA